MTPSPSAMPPVPPAIAAQQQAPPPLQQFAQGAADNSQATPQAPPTDQLLAQLVDQVGSILTKIAQITGQTKPELIPILKQAVQAMALFADKSKVGQQGAPDGGQQGTGSNGAPDAGGGSAMGMPQ